MSNLALILRALAAVLALYLLLCAAMFALQRRLQYLPDATPVNAVAAGLPQAATEVLVTTDGERLQTWWIAPTRSDAPVYLYFHGNGANLHARAQRFARITTGGAGLLAVSWRGYGGSTGEPTEAGLLTDARSAYRTLAVRVDPRRIVAYGESLGTTLATLLAAEVPVGALVLDSSFDSALDVARNAYPWLPVSLLMRDTFRADLAAPRVTVPVLQIHCRYDPVTPLAAAERLQRRFASARPLVVLDQHCHVPSLLDYEGALVDFVAGAWPRR